MEKTYNFSIRRKIEAFPIDIQAKVTFKNGSKIDSIIVCSLSLSALEAKKSFHSGRTVKQAIGIVKSQLLTTVNYKEHLMILSHGLVARKSQMEITSQCNDKHIAIGVKAKVIITLTSNSKCIFRK